MIATPADCKARRLMTNATAHAARLHAWFCWPGAGLGLLSAAGRDKSPNSACLDCHSDKTLTKTNAAGKEVSLFVDEARLKATIHKTNTCADCHADITSKHPDDNVPAQPPSCVKCHEKPVTAIRHQHPWREPQAGRFRRRQLLGLPRLARHALCPRIPSRPSSN